MIDVYIQLQLNDIDMGCLSSVLILTLIKYVLSLQSATSTCDLDRAGQSSLNKRKFLKITNGYNKNCKDFVDFRA